MPVRRQSPIGDFMADLFGVEELEVKIKIITIDGKRMSRSLFFQLRENSILKGEEIKESGQWKISIMGKPLGYLILSDSKILLWKKDNELFRCNFPYKTNYSHCLNKECLDICDNLPHLFLGA